VQFMKKPISTSLVLATMLGSLALVGGLTAIFFNVRYHYRESVFGPCVAIAVGLFFIVIAIRGENPSPRRRWLVIVRNLLIGLFSVGIVLVLLLILIGPLH
jgi:hypothetical protein